MALDPDTLSFFSSRGRGLDASGLQQMFADRLRQAVAAAEAATGQQGSFSDLYRPPERQAQYRANYTRQPVVWNGVTYNPNGPGGLAAPPGQSRHGRGEAADVPRGPILDYLHDHAGEYGLEFLKGRAFAADPVHIQLAGGGNGQNFLIGSAGGSDRMRNQEGEDAVRSPNHRISINRIKEQPTELGPVDVTAPAPVAATPAATENDQTGGLGQLLMGLAAGGAAGMAGAGGGAIPQASGPLASAAQAEQGANEATRAAPLPGYDQLSTSLDPLKSAGLTANAVLPTQTPDQGLFSGFQSRPKLARNAGGIKIRR